MKIWMDVMRDLEHVMDDYQRCFDAWQAGGVDGIVLGPMMFNASKLLPTLKRPKDALPPAATYDPNPKIYERLGVPAPEAPEPMPQRRALLEKMLGHAKDRGMTLMIFQPMAGTAPMGEAHTLADARVRTSTIARMVDTFEHYPMIDGGVMDRPEWSYEIASGHVVQPLFDDLPAEVAPLCARLGYDYEALVAAKDRLHRRLCSLDVRRVRRHGGGGLFDSFSLLGRDPDLMAWFQFRVESVTDYFRDVRQGVASHLGHPIQLGVGPRTSAFALLSGYDFAQLAEFMDVLLPKHYFWDRGFDGLVGTVRLYVRTLCDWNPGLTDADALAVVQSLFGLVLPGVTCRADLDRAFTPEFFQRIVASETARALAVVDDPNRIVPWVDAGRFPHDGDPVSANDLRQLLEASAQAGLERFLYHHHGNMTAGEWSVMSEMCGQRWEPEPDGYRPPDRFEL
ncbi:MAG: hypothetical protein CMJ18_02130 [Phycisphaeraceae bacterium]|nr:hypothetical protein [Phycisphaeraceae bacterium]